MHLVDAQVAFFAIGQPLTIPKRAFQDQHVNEHERTSWGRSHYKKVELQLRKPADDRNGEVRGDVYLAHYESTSGSIRFQMGRNIELLIIQPTCHSAGQTAFYNPLHHAFYFHRML